MIWFVFEVILLSIVVSAISYALRLIPRYAKRSHRILQQVMNTGLLTIVFTFLFVFGVEPGWVVTGSMIFLSLIVSIITTNFVARNRGSNPS
jgi:hypothetical protein